MRPNSLDTELQQLTEERNINLKRQVDVLVEKRTTLLMDYTIYEDHRRRLNDRMAELEAEEREISRKISENQACYRRPSGKISGLFSRGLAPLPHRLPDTEIDDRAEETMASLPSYRFAALATFLGVVATLVGIATTLPWLLVSPLSLVVSAGGASSSTQSTVSLVIMLCLAAIVAIAIITLRSKARTILYKMAHEEEKWYRAGAENWSMRQRAVSCLMFGACHVVNIIYPFVTCVALCMAGAAFMAVYLAEYRRSGDVYRATMASTKMHARYNIYAFMLILIASVVFMVSTILL